MTAPVLARTSTGAVRLPMRQVGGARAVAHRLQHRLRTERGTALEDVERGCPWSRWATTAPLPTAEIDAVLREQVALEPGVAGVTLTRVVRAANGSITVTIYVDIRAEDTVQSVAIVVADPYLTSGAPEWYFVSEAMAGG